MGKYLKRHYIFGGNTDRGVIPPRQFLPNISLSIERSFFYLTSIVFVSSRRFKIDPW